MTGWAPAVNQTSEKVLGSNGASEGQLQACRRAGLQLPSFSSERTCEAAPGQIIFQPPSCLTLGDSERTRHVGNPDLVLHSTTILPLPPIHVQEATSPPRPRQSAAQTRAQREKGLLSIEKDVYAFYSHGGTSCLVPLPQQYVQPNEQDIHGGSVLHRAQIAICNTFIGDPEKRRRD